VYGLRGSLSTKGMEMVKVESKGNAGVTIEIGPIDIDLLKKQANMIADLTILNDDTHILWGVVEMLNDIIDELE
jgi:hypothetical protein